MVQLPSVPPCGETSKGTRDRERLEAELLQTMREAEQAYRRAVENSRIVGAQYADLPLGHPDGAEARRKAMRIETAALSRWRSTLQAFTDLVIGGVPPKTESR